MSRGRFFCNGEKHAKRLTHHKEQYDGNAHAFMTVDAIYVCDNCMGIWRSTVHADPELDQVWEQLTEGQKR